MIHCPVCGIDERACGAWIDLSHPGPPGHPMVHGGRYCGQGVRRPAGEAPAAPQRPTRPPSDPANLRALDRRSEKAIATFAEHVASDPGDGLTVGRKIRSAPKKPLPLEGLLFPKSAKAKRGYQHDWASIPGRELFSVTRALRGGADTPTLETTKIVLVGDGQVVVDLELGGWNARGGFADRHRLRALRPFSIVPPAGYDPVGWTSCFISPRAEPGDFLPFFVDGGAVWAGPSSSEAELAATVDWLERRLIDATGGR